MTPGPLVFLQYYIFGNTLFCSVFVACFMYNSKLSVIERN